MITLWWLLSWYPRGGGVILDQKIVAGRHGGRRSTYPAWRGTTGKRYERNTARCCQAAEGWLEQICRRQALQTSENDVPRGRKVEVMAVGCLAQGKPILLIWTSNPDVKSLDGAGTKPLLRGKDYDHFMICHWRSILWEILQSKRTIWVQWGHCLEDRKLLLRSIVYGGKMRDLSIFWYLPAAPNELDIRF